MSYQKCPVCMGTGIVGSAYYSYHTSTCPTCKGARIIDELTGIPPEGAIPRTITSTGDITVTRNEDGTFSDHNGDKILSTPTKKQNQ